MLNEWQEFLDYTGTVDYKVEKKSDTSYLGRFTFDTIMDLEGLARVLTIIARGYLFHDTDWVVLPVANFDAYFGSTMFSRKHMGKLPKEIVERSEHGFGVSRYRVPEEYLPHVSVP